ncbi:MAG: hypothetical protein AAFN70_19575, partial [Planctomycetota bacterium]
MQRFVGIDPQLTSASVRAPAGWQTVWQQPEARVLVQSSFSPADVRLDAQQIMIETPWMNATLAGAVIWNDQTGSVRLSGPTKIEMPQIAETVSDFAGTRIELRGTSNSELKITVDRMPNDDVNYQIDTELAWEGGQAEGVVLGAGRTAISIDQSRILIPETIVPLASGSVRLAGTYFHSADNQPLVLPRGTLAENIAITPVMCRRWLKYVLPAAADAADMDGTFSLTLAEDATIPMVDPTRATLDGSLAISRATVSTGPMARQLIGTIRNVNRLVSGDPLRTGDASTVTLVQMPPQTIDVRVADQV